MDMGNSKNPEKKPWQLELDEYIRQGEPGRARKAESWQTAIGLQQVDCLEVSEYLIDTAKLHVEGDIDTRGARERIESYYEQRRSRGIVESKTEEADLVSQRITRCSTGRFTSTTRSPRPSPDSKVQHPLPQSATFALWIALWENEPCSSRCPRIRQSHRRSSHHAWACPSARSNQGPSRCRKRDSSKESAASATARGRFRRT